MAVATPGRRGYLAVVARFGCRSLAHLRHERCRLAVVLAGWPAGATWKDVELMRAVAAGPLTTRQLAAALRLAYRDGNFIVGQRARRCVAAGWVSKTFRSRGRGNGRGGREAVYTLAAAVGAG